VGGETAESREQWAEDMDTDVSRPCMFSCLKLEPFWTPHPYDSVLGACTTSLSRAAHIHLVMFPYTQANSLSKAKVAYGSLDYMIDCVIQVRPVKEEVRRDRPAGQAGKEVHGVRLGAGDRSYLVRDKQIEVLKNVYGGVQVRHSALHGHCIALIAIHNTDSDSYLDVQFHSQLKDECAWGCNVTGMPHPDYQI